MVVTIFVVYRGIGKGIERVARLLMPVLLAILALMLVNAMRMPGAGEALTFLFRPNFALGLFIGARRVRLLVRIVYCVHQIDDVIVIVIKVHIIQFAKNFV